MFFLFRKKRFWKELEKEYHLKQYLTKEEHALLKELYHYHWRTVVHVIRVAEDCKYVAQKLGFSQKDQEALYVAALLHDIGKLGMQYLLLDSSLKQEDYLQILKEKGIPPRGDILQLITMEEMIQWQMKLPFWKKHHLSNYEGKRILQQMAPYERKMSIRAHLQLHQQLTRIYLERIGTDPRIIAIAAHHHPEYLTAEAWQKLEQRHLIQIMSIVDKFNAMVQSEGKRKYAKPMSDLEALHVLIEHYREKNILKSLAEKYLYDDEQELVRLLHTMLEIKKKRPLTHDEMKKILFNAHLFLTVTNALELESPHKKEIEALTEMLVE